MRVGMRLAFSKSKTNEFQKNKKSIAKVMLQVCCCVVLCVSGFPAAAAVSSQKAKDLHSGPTGNPEQSECGWMVVCLLLVCAKWIVTLCIFLFKLHQAQCCQLRPRVKAKHNDLTFSISPIHHFNDGLTNAVHTNQRLVHLCTFRPFILKPHTFTSVRVHLISSRWRCNIIYRPSARLTNSRNFPSASALLNFIVKLLNHSLWRRINVRCFRCRRFAHWVQSDSIDRKSGPTFHRVVVVCRSFLLLTHTHTYVCMHTYICVYVCMYIMYICMYMMYEYSHIQTHISIYIYIQYVLYMCVYSIYMYTHMYVCMYLCKDI